MIRVKCKDDKEIRLVRQSKIFTEGFPATVSLNNIESLATSNDLLPQEYYGTGSTYLYNKYVDCVGIDANKLLRETGGKRYQINDKIAILIEVTYLNDSLRWDIKIIFEYNGNKIFTTSSNYAGGYCQKIYQEKMIYANYIADVRYSDYPRILLCTESDDITKIENIQILIMQQSTDKNNFTLFSYVPFRNLRYDETDYHYAYLREFFLELRGAATISEPISDSIPDVNGDYDNTSDEVTIDDINNINLSSALQSDFVKCYEMSAENLNKLSEFLWSDNFINVIKKLQNDPIENIQKLCFYPFEVEKGVASNIWIGNADSNISAPRVVKQFQEIDFGNLKISEYYGNTLDYETDISIFLPFIGEKLLSAFDIMGGTINLKYRVDILTGACVAIISAVRVQNDVTLNSVLYTFSGDMSNEVPLTASQNNFLKSLVANPLDVKGTLTTALNGGLASAIGGMSHSYSHTGNIGGNVGYLSVMTPYLIIRRPVNVKPSDYERTFGYPACTSVTLENQKGYCRYRECYFDSQLFDLEKEVCDEILNKLKTKGIYIK